MMGSWVFIIPFSPLLYMFAIFHNKKLKNKKSPSASETLKREPQPLTRFPGNPTVRQEAKVIPLYIYICIFVF